LAFGGGATKADVEKAQTLSLLQDFKPTDKIGVLAFNTQAFTIANLLPLEQQYQKIVDKVSSLRDGGGTLIHVAIDQAINMLEGRSGANYIILISDGKTQALGTARTAIDKAVSKGIRIFTVGIGKDTHINNMQDFAIRGKGMFFQPETSQRLRIAFSRAPEDTEGRPLDEFALQVMDENHFITQFLDLNGTIAGYNIVTPKSSARMLVATDQGIPITTIWRFGLGRVVALTTDDGGSWAGDLLSARNSQVISRSINWAIGDLSRRASHYVDIPDTSIDKPVEVIVRAGALPEVSGIDFSKIDKNLYSATFQPEKIGFNELLGKKYAVNYASEYERIGFNTELNQTVKASGGTLLDINNLDKLIKDIKAGAKRIKTDYLYYRWPLVALALILFLLEVCTRRILENRRQ